MSRKILQDIIDDFNAEDFTRFFRSKHDKFQHPNELLHYEDDNFGSGKKLEEITFEDGNLIVCSFEVKRPLSERSGKKAQYELGKSILKENQTDASIFIFYDKSGSFRFSLIYANYLGRRRDWSTFRRFTYFVSKELTNKTFLQRIGDGDFSSLAKIKEAFSVEKVTKEFYEDIANWYFWAVEHSRFPKDAEAEINGRNVAIIRLITRMIFIWFMRERGLINKELFEKEKIYNTLKNLDNTESSYYTAILQNLFFATLSTKKEERQFGSEIRGHKGYNPDFGNQYVFRYQELFKNPENIKDYFCDIPFLNGGLFECLDDKKNGVIIDGFSRIKKNQPEVPNLLFFGAEQKVDLNQAYGTKNKTYKVRGLLDILSSFNFTIDENSPDDADIALDPELLGRVFENLLASFNPETSTTARKATGSYYTPREIVDYMVTESLKEYFKTHLKDVQDIDKKLETLSATGSDENPFSKMESKKLVELIESVHIVDPAVGSGAFPMGALNKMVFILNKVDPGNELWKQAQLDATEAIPDPQVRRNTKKQIEEFFKDKNADYGRKLYLIQKCIYGVDIQQIAVEIAKLRFFISLLVDEKIDKEKENWGIEPLPNLDFKIMQGNSLISEFLGIDFDNGQAHQQQAGMLFAEKEDTLIKEFEQKKINFQNESDKDKKAKLKNDVEDLMIKIFETKVRTQKADYFRQMDEVDKKYATLPNKKTREEIIAKEKQKLSEKTGFDLENIEKQLREFTSKNKTKPFFAWKLYFAEVFKKGGFDIVVANPPYVDSENMTKDNEKFREILSRIYKTAKGNWDLFIVFIERGLQLLRTDATITYIVPNKLVAARYSEKLRGVLLAKNILEIRDYSNANVFKEVDVYPIVFLIQNNNKRNDVVMSVMQSETELKLSNRVPAEVFYKDIHWGKYFSPKEVLDILLKMSEHSGLGLLSGGVSDAATVSEAYQIKEYLIEKSPRHKESYKKLINTGSIDRYVSLWGKQKTQYIKNGYMEPVISDKDLKKISATRFRQATSEKIIIAGMSKELECFYDTGEYLAGKSTTIILRDNLSKEVDLKYTLALLNSNLVSFWFQKSFGALSLAGGYLQINNKEIEKIPIPVADSLTQKKITSIVDKIITTTKPDDYLENSAKQAKVREYEKQIDQLVYNLYGLTPEEIKAVETPE